MTSYTERTHHHNTPAWNARYTATHAVVAGVKGYFTLDLAADLANHPKVAHLAPEQITLRGLLDALGADELGEIMERNSHAVPDEDVMDDEPERIPMETTAYTIARNSDRHDPCKFVLAVDETPVAKFSNPMHAMRCLAALDHGYPLSDLGSLLDETEEDRHDLADTYR